MIAFYQGIDAREKPKLCDCGGCQYQWIEKRVEVMPDLSRMNRADRRAMEAIARRYGIELRK